MKESQDEKKPASPDANVPSCEQIENRIHELLDHRQPLLSDELVRQHVSQCDACAGLVVDFGALNDSLSQIPISTLQRLSDLKVAKSATQSSMRLHPVSFVACVACLLLVMLTSGIWFAPQAEVAVSSSGKETANEGVVTSNVSVPTPTEFVATVVPQFQKSMDFLPTIHETSPSLEFIHTVSFEQLSSEVGPIQDYIGMTADLPGIRPISKSVNATYEFLRVISEVPANPKGKSPSDAPDVGFNDGLIVQLCSV